MTKFSTSKLVGNEVVSDEEGIERTEELTEDQQKSKYTASTTQVENVQNDFNGGRYCCNIFLKSVNLSFVVLSAVAGDKLTNHVTRKPLQQIC